LKANKASLTNADVLLLCVLSVRNRVNILVKIFYCKTCSTTDNSSVFTGVCTYGWV